MLYFKRHYLFPFERTSEEVKFRYILLGTLLQVKFCFALRCEIYNIRSFEMFVTQPTKLRTRLNPFKGIIVFVYQVQLVTRSHKTTQ